VVNRRSILGKVLQSFLTLFFVLTFNFFLFRIMPGDPVALLLRGTSAITPEVIAELEKDLGLDQPLPQQFVTYLGDTLTGNWGLSLQTGEPVTSMIADGIGPTVLLVGLSTIASAIIGVLIGIYGGWRRGSRFDLGSTGVTLVAYAMPEFWLGILLLLAFAGGVGPFPALFPTGGYSTPGADLTGLSHWVDVLNHMVLPFVTLTIAYVGEYSLIMRSSMLDVVGDDYLTTARAKGLRDRQVMWRHAVRNAMLPTFTVTMLSLGFVFAGAITVEYVFSWPGLGLATVEAIDSKDFPMLQGLFLLFSVAVIVFNLAADLLYPKLDPRVRAA
jgi:peptide/nickel transport system permease protein